MTTSNITNAGPAILPMQAFIRFDHRDLKIRFQ